MYSYSARAWWAIIYLSWSIYIMLIFSPLGHSTSIPLNTRLCFLRHVNPASPPFIGSWSRHFTPDTSPQLMMWADNRQKTFQKYDEAFNRRIYGYYTINFEPSTSSFGKATKLYSGHVILHIIAFEACRACRVTSVLLSTPHPPVPAR
jgi:hypothetical protein